MSNEPLEEHVDEQQEKTGAPADRYVSLLGVACDAPQGCDWAFEGDYVVGVDDTKATRLGYVLKDAAVNGWTVIGDDPLTARTYCPEHAAAGAR